ncbi:MAG: NAD(P)-dependent dehydrogenase (short-subunit alcohol dehydrogenase family) [Verrucomicrobiales bacterium]|jgi:NAD(P)-dependent dehydrogenase (short-subunit alcohol dehydrogenase family)
MTTAFHLTGKIIAITGASSGIGQRCAQECAKMGANVIAIGRDETRLKETVHSLHAGDHVHFAGDLTAEGMVSRLTDSLPDSVDGIVHAAGLSEYQLARFVRKPLFDELNRINYEVPFLLTVELLKKRKIAKGGSIVFIASVAGLIAAPANAVYGGTKAAIISVSRHLAIESAPSGIRVNSIAPGMVNTPMTDRAREKLPPGALEANEKLYPLGYGEPEDVAHATVYLLSDAAKWVTGSTLVIDGGYSSAK